MGRYYKRGFDDDQYEINNPDERYNMAYKRVKKIKGFYIHFLVYILVNGFILARKFYKHGDEDFWNWDTFSTALFWGIGIIAHASSVFGKNLFFGKNWEERKIQEFLEKDKEQERKWE
ncbi:2TM domain-containing protein [Flavobacterium cellulosilyticum]|uniref:2TM domain-containing protein n=1 Tax=Flavobacterium cellulosilyticum TaxID=2541731 RepID=A0A4R5CJU0_9FLAO|nr:2TM domain-containing protein [Flavobacterium cellulosilyticum]TDD98623.1 2TM domain-containing protein [Flavobacterium cellulosilyticum]